MADSDARPGGPDPDVVVVMGVSGSGKTTVAHGIAAATGLLFAEADDFHSRANVDKMSAGTPLDDADRWPWLHDLAAWMGERAAEGRSTVIACSALKRSYRDLLRRSAPSLVFIHLDGPREVIADHLARRDHEFMSPDLLDSQLATLEPLAAEEAHATVDVDQSIPDVLNAILESVNRMSA